MLRFVPDHLLFKKIFKNAVKKLSFIINYVPDQFETQEMCDKVILENGGMVITVPNCYKNKKMCTKLLIIMFMHFFLSVFKAKLFKSLQNNTEFVICL